MKIYLYFTLLITFFSINFTNAQITIETVFDKELKIKIQDNKEVYTIKLRILDSISTNQKYLDELIHLNESYYIASKKSYKSAETIQIGKKIIELKKKNHFFSFREISINKSENKAFSELIDLIYNSTDEVLNGIDNNKIILHGQPILITLDQNGIKKKIYNNASDKTNYPLTTKLIEESLQIFRNKKLIPLDKRKTCGF